ncbi:LacI family DNA-binding transcriptional regulator [Puniceicoccaceae bacterium K14]|nr:LacI family DNA-binding transcriptional regulator [Puniceicoccaceae bacterium K14]
MADLNKRPITLRQIAKELSVSLSTVSLALRDNPKISLTRRIEVKRMAKELGYHPDPLLRQLGSYSKISKGTPIRSTIAWIDDEGEEESFSEQSEINKYFEGAKSMGEDLGFRLERFNRKELGVTRKRLCRILSSRGIRGVIIPPHSILHEVADETWGEFAIIRIGFNKTTSKRHIVCPDQFEGGRLAAINMLAAGYETLGYVGLRSEEERSRYHYFSGFVTSRDLLVPSTSSIPPLFFDSENLVEGKEVYRKWLHDHKIDAVLVAHFHKLSEWTCELAPEIGRGIGLAGTNVYAPGFNSGLDQRSFEVGEAAMQLLARLIDYHEFGIPKAPQRLLISPTWVNGKSMIGAK